jgi:protein subunit release factor A
VFWFSLSQEASAAIVGVGVFGKLKFESGIHRVQVFDTASHIKYMNISLSTISNILFF